MSRIIEERNAISPYVHPTTGNYIFSVSMEYSIFQIRIRAIRAICSFSTASVFVCVHPWLLFFYCGYANPCYPWLNISVDAEYRIPYRASQRISTNWSKRMIHHPKESKKMLKPSWSHGTPTGARALVREQAQQLSFRDKVRWLEEAETVAAQFQSGRLRTIEQRPRADA